MSSEYLLKSKEADGGGGGERRTSEPHVLAPMKFALVSGFYLC